MRGKRDQHMIASIAADMMTLPEVANCVGMQVDQRHLSEIPTPQHAGKFVCVPERRIKRKNHRRRHFLPKK
jgi:hypothetical protein